MYETPDDAFKRRISMNARVVVASVQKKTDCNIAANPSPYTRKASP